jgi:hypothetical protein
MSEKSIKWYNVKYTLSVLAKRQKLMLDGDPHSEINHLADQLDFYINLVEPQVFIVLDLLVSEGKITTDQYDFLVGYCKRLIKYGLRFHGKQYDQELAILKDEYYKRGFSSEVLDALDEVISHKIQMGSMSFVFKEDWGYGGFGNMGKIYSEDWGYDNIPPSSTLVYTEVWTS